MDCSSVLIVPGSEVLPPNFSSLLKSHDIEMSEAQDCGSAILQAQQSKFAVGVLHIDLLEKAGVELAQDLKNVDSDMEIIFLSKDTDLPWIHAATNGLSFDILPKPLRNEELVRSVKRAIERRQLLLRNRRLTSLYTNRLDGSSDGSSFSSDYPPDTIKRTSALVGNSSSFAPIRQLIMQIAPTDVTVLVRGESGTGKDIVAHLLHELSGRSKKGDFVKINCPAIPETLLEAEIFGHEAGAFTGADKKKPGRFELAAGGTVFLDEIGDLPLSSQAKLLQVLEHKEFNRVGGTKTIKINARIVAATNAPLEELIEAGKFRADLYFRLNQFAVYLPPLRERLEDLPHLIEHLISQHNHKSPTPSFSQETLEQLSHYHFPGNVRELKYLVDRFLLTGDEQQILRSLSQFEGKEKREEPQSVIEESEAKLIQCALIEERWNQRKAAEKLGISYSALRRRIEKYGLKGKPAGSV